MIQFECRTDLHARVFVSAICTLVFQSFLLTLSTQLSTCIMKNSYFIHSGFVWQELLFVLVSLTCINQWVFPMKRYFTFFTM